MEGKTGEWRLRGHLGAIHHGGGVGIGYSIHAGQVIVAETAIIRHVDAGYKKAIEVAKRHGLKIPMMK